MPYERISQAVILVGGKGTRLGILTQNTPKPLMLLYENMTFLDFLIKEISHQGFTEILLLSGHFSEQFIDKYNGQKYFGAAIKVITEDIPLGTAGALKNACDDLHERFMMTNGDSFLQTSYRDGEAVLQKYPHALASMILRMVDDASRYGSVILENNLVEQFHEKAGPTCAGNNTAMINAGIYFMNKAVIEHIPDGATSLETDIFPKLAAANKLAGVEAGGYFIDIGLPETLGKAREEIPKIDKRPTLFLDRDGVINIDHGYVYSRENFDWIDGVKDMIKYFNQRGWYVIVVTNQAGIARGYYTAEQMHELHRFVQNELALHGAYINEFYYCPYHEDAKLDEYRHPDHPSRKPNPGMLLQAMGEWPIDIELSILIGDKDKDVQAARAAGIKGYLFNGGNLMTFAQMNGLLDC